MGTMGRKSKQRSSSNHLPMRSKAGQLGREVLKELRSENKQVPYQSNYNSNNNNNNNANVNEEENSQQPTTTSSRNSRARSPNTRRLKFLSKLKKLSQQHLNETPEEKLSTAHLQLEQEEVAKKPESSKPVEKIIPHQHTHHEIRTATEGSYQKDDSVVDKAPSKSTTSRRSPTEEITWKSATKSTSSSGKSSSVLPVRDPELDHQRTSRKAENSPTDAKSIMSFVVNQVAQCRMLDPLWSDILDEHSQDRSSDPMFRRYARKHKKRKETVSSSSYPDTSVQTDSLDRFMEEEVQAHYEEPPPMDNSEGMACFQEADVELNKMVEEAVVRQYVEEYLSGDESLALDKLHNPAMTSKAIGEQQLGLVEPPLRTSSDKTHPTYFNEDEESVPLVLLREQDIDSPTRSFGPAMDSPRSRGSRFGVPKVIRMV